MRLRGYRVRFYTNGSVPGAAAGTLLVAQEPLRPGPSRRCGEVSEGHPASGESVSRTSLLVKDFGYIGAL